MHIDMEAGPQVSGAFREDVSRGANVSRVASEWYSRPADQRFLSLSDLYASVRGRADRSHNRVHPETYRCADPWRSQRRLMRTCHELEIALALTRTNHGLGRDDASLAPVKGKAADMEAHTGVGSFARWVRDTARDDLLAAKDKGWPELHKAAARLGLEIKPRGAGLVFVDAGKPDRAVKASSVDRALSMGALVKACGPYQPAPERLPPTHFHYKPQPLQEHAKARSLHERYQAERETALKERSLRIAQCREEQRAYRQQLTGWYREEKHKLEHGWLESLSLDKAQRRRELAQQRAKLWERSHKAGKDAVAKIRQQHPLPVWKDWLERQAKRRDRDAMSMLAWGRPTERGQPERIQPPQPLAPSARPADPFPERGATQPWSASLGGEFTYLGQRDSGGGPALVWEQGGKHYIQAATRNAVMLAQDVEKGDRVVFFQGRPIITHSHDLGHGR